MRDFPLYYHGQKKCLSPVISRFLAAKRKFTAFEGGVKSRLAFSIVSQFALNLLRVAKLCSNSVSLIRSPALHSLFSRVRVVNAMRSATVVCLLIGLGLTLVTEAKSRSNSVYKLNDDQNCQLHLYRVQEFQGRAYIINGSKKRLRGLEKSLRTVGKNETTTLIIATTDKRASIVTNYIKLHHLRQKVATKGHYKYTLHINLYNQPGYAEFL